MKAGVDFGRPRNSTSTNVAEIAEQAVARTAESQPVTTKSLPDTYETVGDITAKKPVMRAKNVDVYYADNRAIKNVSIEIGRNEVSP